MSRREKWILALTGLLVLVLLGTQGIGLWIMGPLRKILVDKATAAMLAEVAAVFLWNLWCLRRTEKPGIQVFGCLAGILVFIWCHRAFTPLAVTAAYAGVLLMAGRLLCRLFARVTGASLRLPAAEAAGMDLILGCALWIVLVCAVSLTGHGGLRLWRLLALAFGGFCLGFFLCERPWRAPGHALRSRAFLPETKLQAVLAAFALTMVMVQAGRLNIALDYDSLHYGLRSAYVLDNGMGIYEDLGMINLVYTYPKGLEVLALPLSGTPTYGFVLSLSFWATVGILLLTGHIAGRRGGKNRKFWAMAMMAAVPGIMNMAATAKSDNVTLLFQLLFFDFVCCALGAAGEKEERQPWFLMGLSAYLMTLVLKPTAIVFSTIMAGVCLFCLIWRRKLRVRAAGWGYLLPILPAAAVAGLWYRTWKLTGVPATSIFAGLFEKIGFQVRLPYSFTHVIGNPASLSAGEKLARLARRLWGMAALPLGEDMDHVIIAWGTGLIAVLLFLWICWFFAFVRKGGLRRPTAGRPEAQSARPMASGPAAQPASPEAEDQPACLAANSGQSFCEALLIPTLGLACVYSIYTLSQVDGNYFVLFYALLIISAAGLGRLGTRRSDLERNLSGLIVPLLIANVFVTCCTSWAGTLGFTPIALRHLGYYDHRAEREANLEESGAAALAGLLNPRSRVVAFGEHPQVLELPCSAQSYYDITGSGGNVYLVKKLDYFKWYLDISGTEYIFAEGEYLRTHDRAGDIIRYMIEDGSLTDLVCEGDNLLGRVSLGGPDGDGIVYDRERVSRQFETNFYEYLGQTDGR